MRERSRTILLMVFMGGVVGVVSAGVGFWGRGVWEQQRPHAVAASQPGTAKRKILYYWDSMLGPSSISDKPGVSAMGMALEPVYEGDAGTDSVVKVDPAVVQNMGLQTATVVRGVLHKTLRTVGYLKVPETGLCDITLKVNGYIDKLYADKTGMTLKKGDPLFDLYSPDLVVAEEELIAANDSAGALRNASPEVKEQAGQLLASARRKLQLWDIPEDQISAIAAMKEAPKDATIRAPASGKLEDKEIVQGSSVRAGMKLMRIEDQRTLWLEAQVYEGQLPLVTEGATAQATFDALPGKTFSGAITFIDPDLKADTRTVNVRVVLQNPLYALKPGMYATVQIHSGPMEETMLIPTAAVIDTGTEKVVFVQDGSDHFSPRLVTTGLSGDGDQTQVLAGLSEGDTVVTSGQFLLDGASRTQEAMQKIKGPAPAAAETKHAAAGETDDVVKAYLAVAEFLQKDSGTSPAEVSELVRASGVLAGKAGNSGNRALALGVRESAAAMAGESRDAQHKAFEKVGGAMLELLKGDRPSKKVGDTLYVFRCAMEKANWLQTNATVVNPFLPGMRTCGEIIDTWNLKAAE